MYTALLVAEDDSYTSNFYNDNLIGHIFSDDLYYRLYIYDGDIDYQEDDILAIYHIPEIPVDDIYIHDQTFEIIEGGALASAILFDIDDLVLGRYPETDRFYNQTRQPQSQQQYERTRAERLQYARTKPHDSCMLDISKDIMMVEDLKYPLIFYQDFCKSQRTLEERGNLKNIFDSKYRAMSDGVTIVEMNYYDSNGTVNEPEYFFEVLARNLITEDPLSIVFTDSIASDYGGLTRSVFSKAGEYIKSMLLKSGENGRYYFHNNLTTEFILKMKHVIKFAICQGAYLDLPLGHGIIYSIQTGWMPNEIELHNLMYLYKLDHSDEALLEILKYITRDYIEYLPDLDVRVRGIAGQLQAEGKIGDDDLIEWLYRYLQHEVYGPGPHDPLNVFINLKNGEWGEGIATAVQESGIAELANIIGSVSSLADVLDALNRATVNDNIAQDHSKEFLTRYISENPEMAERLIYFISGATNAKIHIQINIHNINSRFPDASTCANALNIFAYTDYSHFKRDMDIALQVEDLSRV